MSVHLEMVSNEPQKEGITQGGRNSIDPSKSTPKDAFVKYRDKLQKKRRRN